MRKGAAKSRGFAFVKTVNSVDHAAKLLILLGERSELGVSDLSRALGIPRATIYRLVRTLILYGLVKQNGTRYRLGYRVLELASQVPELPTIERQVVPLLQDLMTRTGETSHFAVVDEGYVTYLAKVDSPHPIRMFSRVGWRGPLHATGVGKAILAHSPPELLDKVIAEGLMPLTSRTIVDPDHLKAELDSIRGRGLSIDDGELIDGLYCMAVPVLNGDRCHGAVSIAGPRDRMLAGSAHAETLADIASQVGGLF